MDGSLQGYLVFPNGRGDADMATHIRSTLIMSSQKTLREAGLFPQYESRLAPRYRQLILETAAPVWLGIDVGLAHYEACDALDLGPNRVAELAQGVSAQRRGTFLGVAVGLAAGLGVTPWTVLSETNRVWRRAWQGGAIGSLKTGETDARIEVVGWPCARIAYCRDALRGLMLGVAGLLSKNTTIHELPGLQTESSVAYRLSWS